MRKLVLYSFVIYNVVLLVLATYRPIGMTVDTPGLDLKLHHLAAMALYAVLVWWLVPQKKSLRGAAMPLIATTVFGAVIEVIQAFLPHRSGQLADLVSNTIGILIGYGVIGLSAIWRSRRGRQRCEPDDLS